MAQQKLTEQEKVRRQKMQDLRDMGIDPFGAAYKRTTTSGKIVAEYEDKTKEELQELNVHVKIAGRIMTKRRQGKAGFMHIQDIDGQIQIYVRKDVVGDDQYEVFKKSDLGDIVGIEGTDHENRSRTIISSCPGLYTFIESFTSVTGKISWFNGC